MSRNELFTAFIQGKTVTLRSASGDVGMTGVIAAIEREDGSGNCWNLTVQVNGERFRLFVRTK